jgi:hypothetical protein
VFENSVSEGKSDVATTPRKFKSEYVEEVSGEMK